MNGDISSGLGALNYDINLNLLNSKRVQAELKSMEAQAYKTAKAISTSSMSIAEKAARLNSAEGLTVGPKTSVSVKNFTDNQNKIIGQTVTATKSLTDADGNQIRVSQKLLDTNKKVASSYENIMKKMNTLRWTMVNATFVFAAFVVPLISVGKAYVEFGMKVARVAAISGKSNDEIRNSIYKLQKGSIYSLNEVADAYVEFVKLGFRVEDSTEAMASITKLATVGFTDLKTAVAITGQVLYQFGLDVKDTEAVVNILASGANASAADVETFGVALSYVGGVAASLNMSLEDTIATLAVLSNQGLKSSKMGTNLAAALNAMASPTAKSEKIMNQLGISFFDASGNIKDVEILIKDLYGVLGQFNDQSQLQILDQIFGTRGGRAVQALMNQYEDTGSAIADMTEKMKEMGNVATLNNMIMAEGAAQAASLGKQISGWWTKLSTEGGSRVYAKSLERDMTLIANTFGKFDKNMNTYLDSFDSRFSESQSVLSSYFSQIANVGELNNDEQAKLYNSFIQTIADRSKAEFGKKGLSIINGEDLEEKNKIVLEITKNLVSEWSKMSELSEDTKKNLADMEEEAKVLKEVMNSDNFDKFANAFNKSVLSDYDYALKQLNDDLLEYTINMKNGAGYTQKQVDLWYQVESATLEQNKFLSDLSNETERYSNKLKLANRELSDNKDRLNDVNDGISDLVSKRWSGQTDADKFIAQYNMYLKKQELATYGISDAQAWLNEQIGKSSGGFDDLYKSIEKVNNATSNSQDSYSAWQDTVNEFIKDTLAAGNDMGVNVTSSIKKYQTMLLSTSKYSEDSSDKQSDYASALSTAYDVYYGSMSDDVKFATQAHEDFANGVNNSSGSVISSLQSMWVEQDNWKSKVDASQSSVDKLQETLDEYEDIGTKFALDIAPVIMTLNDMKTAADEAASAIIKAREAASGQKALEAPLLNLSTGVNLANDSGFSSYLASASSPDRLADAEAELAKLKFASPSSSGDTSIITLNGGININSTGNINYDANLLYEKLTKKLLYEKKV